MTTPMYLGYPPANIIDWIRSHTQPASHPETRFTIQSGIVETWNITGALDLQWMSQNGYYEGGYWPKKITQADIGNTVTSIKDWTFEGCSGLTSVTMPNVTSIEDDVFNGCIGLTSVKIGSEIQKIGGSAFYTGGNSITLTISKTVAEVQAMGQTDYDWETNVTYSDWGLPSGSTIVCTNGTITI